MTSFEQRLKSLIDQILPAARADTAASIDEVVRAGAISDSSLIQIVRERSVSSEVRATACWMLARLDLEQAPSLLRELLGDPDDRVREEAAAGLGMVGDSTELLVLVDVARRDACKAVKLAALHALGLLGGTAAAIDLLAMIVDTKLDEDLRADAAEACAHMTHPQIVDGLLAALADPSPKVRYSAAYSLGQQGDTRAIARLEALAAQDHAATPWGTVASSAASALGLLRPDGRP